MFLSRHGVIVVAVAIFGITASLNNSVPAKGSSPNDSDLADIRRPTDYILRLGETSFDPLVGIPNLPHGWDTALNDGPDLHLVQFVGATVADWLDDLKRKNVDIVQYIYPCTYIVWGSPQNLNQVGNAEAVRWTGEFHPAYRVLPRWRNLPDKVINVKVLLYRGADIVAAINAIENLGGRSTGTLVLNNKFQIAGFRISGARFQEIAHIPGVYSVKPTPTDGGLRGEMSNQINAGNYDETNQAFPGYEDWLSDVGVDGAGVIIANVDGGVQDNHPDLINRLIACSGDTCGGGQSSAHGTHTAGIMAADGSSGTLDSYGFLRGLGVAPGANIVEQVYASFNNPGGLLHLMAESYANGAFLSGNSWGPSGSPLGYDDDTMQVDIGSRDTDPNTPGDQPLLYVLSIMNGNGGTSSQGTPDEAKNIFTIGSTWMQNSNGSQMLNIDDISSNSAHGPCLDGRGIPHMVAPGCRVDSSVSGSGYGLMCGTSMASPHVTGAVALFLEYYRNLPDYTVDPSPALVKAAFLPVGFDLAGNNDADNGTLGHPFDNKQGWGRLNLASVVDPPADSVRYFDNPIVFDNTGEEWSINLSPLDPNQPVRIMLVWTDAPGHGLGGSTPAWNNDLDLIVDAGGTYRGNNFDADGWSVTGGAADIKNNTEGVFFGPIPPGNFTIRVVASNINSDGLPNEGDDTDQDFAIVCYNVAMEPGFTITAEPSSQDICAPETAVYEVTVGQILGYDEPVLLSTADAPGGASITFDENPIIPPGTTTMTIGNTDGADPGQYNIQIIGTSPDMERTTVVGLGLFGDIPAAPDLLDPPNGATNVSVVPNLQWSAVAQGATYELQVATDKGFKNVVYWAIVEETDHTLESPLQTLTEYYWRVQAHNTCGDGSYSAPFSFTTLDVPSILLVDDDDNSPNVQNYYTDALNALGADFDIWDTNNSDNEPTVQDLAPYQAVIWFTGDEWGGSSGPGGAGETALAAWLDNGGCLFISSQDYHYDRGLTSFMSNYLGVVSASDDVGQTAVTGSGTVFGSMGNYSLSYPFTNYSDTINPQAGVAEVAFTGNVGNAAVNKDGKAYRTTFLGFPLEAISSLSDRADLLQVQLDWCSGLSPDCPADIDGNGIVGTSDLLLLFVSWGPCNGCPADIDGSGAVGTSDLLILFVNWGPCE